MTWLLAKLSGLWKYIVPVVIALGTLGMYGRSKKAQGRSEERAETTEKIHEKVAKADKVRRDQRTAPDKRLRRFDRNR